MSRRGCVAANRLKALDAGKAAANAGIQYWHAKHGPDAVTAQFTDFGCHIKVDIMKNEKVVSSLRYQDGNISEL